MKRTTTTPSSPLISQLISLGLTPVVDIYLDMFQQRMSEWRTPSPSVAGEPA
ncbi:MAG TPA: hypothetical protein VLZ12_09905 [Verrucomicrobiae bacterium]|nr:hypothetical protein [Verrucomicrobiae bacterium]